MQPGIRRNFLTFASPQILSCGALVGYTKKLGVPGVILLAALLPPLNLLRE